MKRLYGLIGFPLGHSFSARYFADKFQQEHLPECEYRNFPLESILELPAMLENHPELCGFNVTIPYKQEVIPYLTDLGGEAREIGAVNCVKITPKGLFGYNTDAYGFQKSLLDLIGNKRPNALILGTGGASKAVAYVLKKLGIPFSFVSRQSGDNRLTYSELTPEVMETHKLIINATPLGTFPKVTGCPAIPYETLTPAHFLFDLVYNPAFTEFLRRGQEQGAAIRNGYDMLIGQAEKAWEIWNTTSHE